jgi:hypothetical protein
MERRLAAILAADAVGYSRLMGEDGAGTLAALKAHRAELFDPKAWGNPGRGYKSPLSARKGSCHAVRGEDILGRGGR